MQSDVTVKSAKWYVTVKSAKWYVTVKSAKWNVTVKSAKTVQIYIFIVITVVFTCTILQYNHLKEKHDKYGNQTEQEGGRLYKNWSTSLLLFKRVLKFSLLHHTFHSVDEFMSFSWYVDCNSMSFIIGYYYQL